jgi:transcriptional regulator with XRE-family HTH domain
MSTKVYPIQEKIRTLRASKGWDQESACEIAGISIRTYQRVESGDGCSIESLKGIASAFDIKFNELLDPPADNDPQGEEYIPSWKKAFIAFIITGCAVPIFYAFIFVLIGIGLVAGMFALFGVENELTVLATHTDDPAAMSSFFVVAGTFFQELPYALLEFTLSFTVIFQFISLLIELPKNKDYSLLVSQPLWNKIKLSTRPARNEFKKKLIQLHKKYPITNSPEDLGINITFLLFFILIMLNIPIACLTFSILLFFLLTERHDHDFLVLHSNLKKK